MRTRDVPLTTIQVAFVCLVAMAPAGSGQVRASGQAAAGDIRASRLETYLSVTAADYTRGRETGSEGYDIAAGYAASLFQVWGLQPGGDLPDPLVRLRNGRGRSFVQTVPLVRNVGDPDTTMTLTLVRGGFRRETVLRRGTDFDVDTTVPFDVTAEPVFVGYGHTAADFNELATLNLRDRFVIRLDGLPGQSIPEGAVFARSRQARQALDRRKMQAAEKGEPDPTSADDPDWRFAKALRDAGAVGCLTVALPPPGTGSAASTPVEAAWAVNAPFRNLAAPALKMYEGDRPPTKRERLRLPGKPFATSGGSRAELFRDPGDPMWITITPEAVDLLLRQLGQTLNDIQHRIDSTGSPASFVLSGATLRIHNGVRTEIVSGKNIIGVIPGTDPRLAGEAVVVSAHLDHIGASNGAIFNGADDNGSGVAGVLELARAFSAPGAAPRRTLVFALWCGEEDGFLGSRYFVSHPTVPLAQIVAVVNLDMIGRLTAPGGSQQRKLSVHTSCQTPLLTRIAMEACRLAGVEAEFLDEKMDDLSAAARIYPNSDHASFSGHDIGFIYLETGLHEDYHTILDHADRIDYGGMERIVRAAFLSVRDIAGLDARPTFDRTIQQPRQAGGPKMIRLEEPDSKPEAPPGIAPGPAPPTAAQTLVAPGSAGAPASPVIAAPATTSPGPGRRSVRLTFDLLGKTDDSRFEGTVTVLAADRLLFRSDTITLRGFRGDRIWARDFEVIGLDLAKATFRWEVSGKLFDSELNQWLELNGAGTRTISGQFEGIGFHVSTTGRKLDVQAVVF